MSSGSEKQVARNFAALALGEALSRVIAFGATVYLARVLGADAYGMVALAAGVNLYLAKVADFGIEAVGAQEVAGRRAASTEMNLGQLVSSALALRIILTALLVVICSGVAQLLGNPPQSTVFSLYFLLLFPIALSTKWVHMGQQNAPPIGITRVFGELVALSGVLLFVKSVERIWLVPIAQLVGDMLVACALIGLLARSGMRLRAPDIRSVLPLFKRAAPLTAQTTLGLILYNSDVLFLRMLRDNTSVGYYASAYTLVSFLVNLGAAHGTSLLPALTHLNDDAEGQRALFQGAQARTFAFALPIVVGGSCVAPDIIELAFGHAYEPSGPVLALLVWSIVPSTARAVCWAALVARGQQRLLLRANVYAVGVNLVANTLLITAYGMPGAATATLLTESFVCAVVSWDCVREGLGGWPIARAWRPAIIGAVMAGVVLALGSWHVVIRIAAGAAVYALGLFAFGIVRLRRGAPPTLQL